MLEELNLERAHENDREIEEKINEIIRAITLLQDSPVPHRHIDVGQEGPAVSVYDEFQV